MLGNWALAIGVFACIHMIYAQWNNLGAALIALRYGESTQMGLSALMAAGLALFTMTLIVNFGASMVVARSRSGAAS